MIESINDENINIKDEYNNNSGIYKILNGNPEKIINCKEIKETNIFVEKAAFYLQTDENVEKLKSFGDKSILETETKNDLNSSNETKYTPLHFACLYNYYELAKDLIDKGATIKSKTRNSNYNPLDLLIIKGNYETLELLLNNSEFLNLINGKNHFNSTPFHSAF